MRTLRPPLPTLPGFAVPVLTGCLLERTGKHGSPWTPDTARTEAERLLRSVAAGQDPHVEKLASRRSILSGNTVVDDVAVVLDRHAAQLRTGKEVRRMFDVDVLPAWGARTLASITRRDVIDLLDRIVDSGRPVRANRIFAAVRKFFNSAVERDLLGVSPCNGGG